MYGYGFITSIGNLLHHIFSFGQRTILKLSIGTHIQSVSIRILFFRVVVILQISNSNEKAENTFTSHRKNVFIYEILVTLTIAFAKRNSS